MHRVQSVANVDFLLFGRAWGEYRLLSVSVEHPPGPSAGLCDKKLPPFKGFVCHRVPPLTVWGRNGGTWQAVGAVRERGRGLRGRDESARAPRWVEKSVERFVSQSSPVPSAELAGVWGVDASSLQVRRLDKVAPNLCGLVVSWRPGIVNASRPAS